MTADVRSSTGHPVNGAAPNEGAPGEAARRVVEARVTAHLSTFGDLAQHVAKLADSLVARAAHRCRQRPERDLLATALEETESDLNAWSFFVLGRERVGDHPAGLVARAAYRACGGADRWPKVLLRYELPDGFVEAMRAAAPPVTPPEHRGRMVPQTLERWSPGDLATQRLWNRLISALAGSGSSRV